MYLLYWYFQQNQCLNLKKKHAVHNIHRLARSGTPGNCPACPNRNYPAILATLQITSYALGV